MSKSTIKQFDAWHKTKPGLAIFGVLELLLAYVVASRALDTGSWWEYGFAVLLTIGGIQNFVKLIGRFIGAKHKPGKARRA
jgi:hypothetical protein